MFIQKPTIKLNKKNKRVYASGFYLLLMRPNDKPIYGNNVRGYVRHVKMELKGEQLISVINVHDHILTLTGNYGNNGYTLSVPYPIYDLGMPLPDSLYTLWNLSGALLKANTEQAEMILWGQAIRAAQRGKPPKTCYRCGNEDSGLIPCKSCTQELHKRCDELINKPKGNMGGIESDVKFGIPTVGVEPPKEKVT